MFEPRYKSSSSPERRDKPQPRSWAAEPDAPPQGGRRFDYADNPCQRGSDAECAQWLHERLTEAYND